MIDTDKYEGHTEGPWLELEVDKVVAYQFDENDNAKMVCNVFRDGDGGSAYEGEWGDDEVEANQKLIADAPLLLEAYKRLREQQKQIHELLAEVLPPKSGFPQGGVLLWGLESELKRVVSEVAIILGMAEREEE